MRHLALQGAAGALRRDGGVLGPEHEARALDATARPRAPARASRPRRCRRRGPRFHERAGQDVGGAEKTRDEQVGRPLVELHRRADLLDHAVVHHGDAVADRVRLLLVVGDEDGGEPEPLLQFAQLAAHLDPQLGVEVGQRLVEQQHLRLDGDGARQRDALLLAAGELRRTAVGEMRQADQIERGGDARRAISARGRRRSSSPKATLRAHGHVRPQRVGLEDHADVALPRRQAPKCPRRRPARAAVGRLKPAIRRSSVVLPQPDGPRKAKNSPGGISRFDVLQHMVVAVGQIDAADRHADGARAPRRRWRVHDDRFVHCRAPGIAGCARRPHATGGADATAPRR